MIRVAIADDLEMLRTGFELIVDNEPDLSVVGSVGTGEDIVDVCRSRAVDVVLMDIRMPGMDGLAASEVVLALDAPPKVLVLTTFGLDEYVSKAIAIGCSGFLLKDATSDALVDAIRTVHAGDAVLSPPLLRNVLATLRPTIRTQPVAGVDDLTDREREVLEQLATGRSNAEIAAVLYLSEATVKTHVTRVFAKLGVRDRVQAVIVAFAAGIAHPGSLPGDGGASG